MKKEHIVYYISILSLIVSGIAIGVSFYRTEKLSMDYLGVIVGILSLLVTALLGWNIYAVIDIKNIKDKIGEISDGASFMMQKGMAVSENTNWMIYHYLLLKKDPIGLQYRFLYHGIACLFHTSQLSDIETCNVIVKGLLECIKDPKSITITKNGKNEILKLLSGVKHTDKIEGFFELLNRMALVNVNS